MREAQSPEVGTCGFTPMGGQPVLTSGKAWVSVTCFEGQEIIRACVTSGEKTENDIAALVDRLEEVNGHYDAARVSQPH
jgi:hypothetical protein